MQRIAGDQSVVMWRPHGVVLGAEKGRSPQGGGEGSPILLFSPPVEKVGGTQGAWERVSMGACSDAYDPYGNSIGQDFLRGKIIDTYA